jgi:hypothetical protein
VLQTWSSSMRIRVPRARPSKDPHQYPIGLPYVILSGQVAVELERYTGKLAGHVVKRQG